MAQKRSVVIRTYIFRSVPITLAAVSVLLWVHSCFYLSGIYWLGYRSHTIHSCVGKIYLQQVERGPVHSEWGYEIADMHQATYSPFDSNAPDGEDWQYAGFTFYSYEYETRGWIPEETRTKWSVAVPWWFITTVCVLISVLAWRRGRVKSSANAFPVVTLQESVS